MLASLQDQALLVLLLLGQERGAGSGFEDFADTFVGLGRALEVLVGADLLADFLTLEYSMLVSVGQSLHL